MHHNFLLSFLLLSLGFAGGARAGRIYEPVPSLDEIALSGGRLTASVGTKKFHFDVHRDKLTDVDDRTYYYYSLTIVSEEKKEYGRPVERIASSWLDDLDVVDRQGGQLILRMDSGNGYMTRWVIHNQDHVRELEVEDSDLSKGTRTIHLTFDRK